MVIIVTGLALSGITAFPLTSELEWLVQHKHLLSTALNQWFNKVYHALCFVRSRAPFLSYGTDWLAFAHLMLAILFVGPVVNPVKNIWVIQFGLVACVLIIPLAFIAGTIRGIPFFWQLVDCSFGIFGSIPLGMALYYLRQVDISSESLNLAQ